jgi:hypothetical protein
MTFQEMTVALQKDANERFLRIKHLARMNQDMRKMAGYKDAEEVLTAIVRQYEEREKFVQRLEKQVPEEEFVKQAEKLLKQ